ncbi:MAG TPA: hypothetical protein ENJ35_01955 [Gammaproteobacteria bacterium]|nr:hypothetical protein [Gammaproteobacteria bacterium]
MTPGYTFISKKFLMRNFLLMLVLLGSLQGKAAIPVIDGSNLAQNILSAVRALTQINNQIQQIDQMAQDLQTIGGSQYGTVGAELNAQLLEIQNTLSTLTQISQSVANIEAEFRVLFPDENTWAAYDYSNYQPLLRQWRVEIDNATIEAMKAQGVVARTAQNINKVNNLIAESQTADGSVRQSQIINQQLAVLSGQMNDTIQLLAANGRLQAAQAAKASKADEASREYINGMNRGYGVMAPYPVMNALPPIQ